MMHSQRRNLLRDVIGFLATSLAARPANVLRKVAESAAPDSNAHHSANSQVQLPRARIAPPTHSVIRRA